MQISLILTSIISLLLGSLVNLIVQRLPREKRLFGWPRCTRCGQSLQWWQVLPVAGWLLQAGRARCCGRPLHWITPMVELLTAGSLIWFFLQYQLSPLFIYLSVITLVLVIVGAIDWLHRWIYTIVILIGTVLALIGSMLIPDHTILNALLGMLIGGFVFILLFMVARMLFPAASAPFGLGDVYLALFLGAAFGLSRLGPALLGGMLLAGLYSAIILVARKLRRPTPTYISYGTFLCLGALLFLILGGYPMD